MSIQWNMGNASPHTGKSVVEQLWYTWSTVGLGPLSAGFRIRAASRGLLDVSSPHVQALDRYLRYILPAGTDPFAITPDMAPICLSLIQTEQGERILVNKTYTGKDGVGRPGAFFVHLLSNLPPDFSATLAISLWRSPFLRSSDINPGSAIQLSDIELDSIPYDDLKQWLPGEIDIMHPRGINSSWLHDCFPLAIRAYLTWRRLWEQWRQAQQLPATLHLSKHQLEPPRLYIAAPSDMVASFILGITRCVPPQLLTGLTFSTYEYDVCSKGQVLLVGTSRAPSSDGKTSTNQELPPQCYQEGVALNCYNYDETKTRLENVPLDISFASYAMKCLTTDNFLELDWLFSEKNAKNNKLDVNSFLQSYDSYLVKAQNPTQRDVELYLDDADVDMLSSIHVQDLILQLAIHDPNWLNNFLKPRLTSLYQQSKVNLKLAGGLTQLAKAASQKAALAANNDDVAAFDAILSIMSWIADNQSEVWPAQLRILATQSNIIRFLASQPDTHFRLLRLWSQVKPALNIDEVRPFLTIQEPYFEAFYKAMPLEWKDIATLALANLAIEQKAVLVLGQKYQRPVAALLKHLSQESWFEAVDLFERLVKADYPHKVYLLSILLDASESVGREKELLSKARMKESEYQQFLIQYSPQYLLSSYKEASTLELLTVFAAKAPTRKMFVLDSWLKSALLVNWFETPLSGPGNLDKVLLALSLTSGESDSFIENYGKYYLERYNQQFPAYLPSSLMLLYLAHYLDSFSPQSLWKPISSSRNLLVFLGKGNSSLLNALPERARLKVQQGYDFWSFLQSPSTSIAGVREFGNILQALRVDRDPELIERLGEAFASRIQSETELASIAYMMSTLLTRPELMQMLYAMAEYVRDRTIDPKPPIQLQAKVVRKSYIQFAFCFESVYDFSLERTKIHIKNQGTQTSMEEKLFLQMLLRILLQHADNSLIGALDERAKGSSIKYWQKWLAFKPLNNSTPAQELLGSSPGYEQPTRSIRTSGRSPYSLDMFIADPSTTRSDVEALGEILTKVDVVGNSQLVERIARAFINCIESETQLTAVTLTLTLRKSVKKSELLQILYTMAEIIRDNIAYPETKDIAELRLVPYIKFILCFESACELSTDEYTLFIRTFLNLLLMSTDEDILQELNDRSKNWPVKISQRWQTHMSLNSRSSGIHRNNSQNGPGRSSSPAPGSSTRDFFTNASSQLNQKQETTPSRKLKSRGWLAWLKNGL